MKTGRARRDQSVGVMTPAASGNRAPREAAASIRRQSGVTPNGGTRAVGTQRQSHRARGVPTTPMAVGTALRMASMRGASATGGASDFSTRKRHGPRRAPAWYGVIEARSRSAPVNRRQSHRFHGYVHELILLRSRNKDRAPASASPAARRRLATSLAPRSR